MQNISVTGRAAQGHPEASKTAEAEDQPRAPSQNTSPVQMGPLPSGSAASSSLHLAAAVGAGQRAGALRAGLQQEATNPESPAIDKREIDAAWNQIVEDDRNNSAASHTQSMSESGVLDKQRKGYMEKVGAWMNRPETKAQLVRQKSEATNRAIDKSLMLPGDILLRKESPPQSTAHASTLPFHLKPNLNGIEPNLGDHNIFHVAQWIGDKSDPSMDPKLEIAEARGGLGTTNALRVLAQSIQVGQYWVYRAKPDYGLPAEARDVLARRHDEQSSGQDTGHESRQSVAPILGKASSVVAEIFAAKKEPYSKSQLSSSMRADSEFVTLTPAAREDIIKLAADPPGMSHVGETSETAHYHAVKTRENEERNEHRGVNRDGGDTCSTFVVRTAQTAALQIAAAYYMEKVQQEAAEQHLDPEQIKQHLQDALGFGAEGNVNDKVKEIFNGALNGFTGMIANNPEGVAPKTIEHFCRDENHFDFVGVLTIAPEDVLEKEKRFDANGQPIIEEPDAASRRGSGSHEDATCCVVS